MNFEEKEKEYNKAISELETIERIDIFIKKIWLIIFWVSASILSITELFFLFNSFIKGNPDLVWSETLFKMFVFSGIFSLGNVIAICVIDHRILNTRLSLSNVRRSLDVDLHARLLTNKEENES